MRSLAWLPVLVLVACRSNSGSIENEARETQALLRQERYDLALTRAEDGFWRASNLGDLKLEWRFRLLRAEALLGRRRAADALRILNEGGDPPAKHDFAEIRGRAFLLRGWASYILRRFSDAGKFLQLASDAAQEAGSPSLAAYVELRRGVLLAMQSRFDESRDTLYDVLDSASKQRDSYLEALAASNVGYALTGESKYDEAIPWYERSRNLATALGAADSVARADGNLGACYAGLGDYEKARMHYEAAEAAFARSGNPDAQQIFIGNAGNVSFEASDYFAAATSYTRALAIARKVPSPVWASRWLSNLAAVSIERGRWDDAERYNNEARALQKTLDDSRYEPNSLNNAGRIAAGRNHLQEAADFFREALKGRAEDPTVPLEAHTGLADIFARGGAFAEAEEEFRTSISAIEQQSTALVKDENRLSWRSSRIRFYRQYVDFLVARNQTARALEVAESSRSRVLEEGSVSAHSGKARQAGDYLKLARDTRAVLVEYWLGVQESYLWVVSSGEIHFHRLPSRAILHPLIDSYGAVITAGRNPLVVAADTGRKLYDTLLAPVVSDAAGNRKFIIVPDDDLYSFNPEALPAGDKSGTFWIEEASVAISPSLNYLAAGSDVPVRRNPMSRLLLIGDPLSSTPQYPRLEFAEQEMTSIASAMGDQSKIFRGADARPETYLEAKPERFEFIHFSAHAAANRENPLDSSVILSGPADRNRLLARDIMKVPLDGAGARCNHLCLPERRGKSVRRRGFGRFCVGVSPGRRGERDCRSLGRQRPIDRRSHCRVVHRTRGGDIYFRCSSCF